MADVLIVDWLGRGGIAQTSQAWLTELRSAGIDAAVVTRPNRELAERPAAVLVPEHANPFQAHRAVVASAVEAVHRLRPEAVVIQNYVLPLLEAPVVVAAKAVGARVLYVVHDHRLHSLGAGSSVGLRRLLRRADDLVVHSAFVGDALQMPHELLPLPLPLGMLAELGEPLVRPVDHLATHFGVLKRRYKNSDLVIALARGGVEGWQFASVGVGAPTSPGLESVNRFVTAGELVATLRSSRAVLLPYRFATQSGAIVLAQACGAVVLTTRIGGLPSQVDDGEDGLLLDADADLASWRRMLQELESDDVWSTLRQNARRRVEEQHQQFRERVTQLVTR